MMKDKFQGDILAHIKSESVITPNMTQSNTAGYANLDCRNLSTDRAIAHASYTVTIIHRQY